LPEALLFVGSVSLSSGGPFVDALKRYLEERGLCARTRFLGHLTDIEGVLAAADIFVLPSRSEGYARALVEALAAGLPCVSTRVGIAPDVIDDGINGYVVDREDHSALAQRLLVLGCDPVARRCIAEAARIRRGIPAPREHGEQLFAMYESLMGPRGDLPSGDRG
jgi:glycosyltransferase involved in cell wall biosynthesis